MLYFTNSILFETVMSEECLLPSLKMLDCVQNCTSIATWCHGTVGRGQLILETAISNTLEKWHPSLAH